MIAAFLTLVDAAIGISLKEEYELRASLFFILNPVSIFVTGYLSQFDNLAILIGWIACCHLSRSEGTRMRELTIGALLLGLSIATKHILLFFPFWMWWLNLKLAIKVRAIVCVVPWLTFLLCFVPFLFDSVSITGITNNVFGYDSFRTNGLIAGIAHAAVDWGLFGSQLEGSLAKLAFVSAVILSGPLWISASKHPKRVEDLMLLYLMSLVVFSSAMANQYLAIPLIALARYYRVVFGWVYSVAATFLLLTTTEGVFGERFANMQLVSFPNTQFLLILALVAVWCRSSLRVRERGS